MSEDDRRTLDLSDLFSQIEVRNEITKEIDKLKNKKTKLTKRIDEQLKRKKKQLKEISKRIDYQERQTIQRARVTKVVNAKISIRPLESFEKKVH